MNNFYLGIAFIPLSLIGGMTNLMALYCLWKYRLAHIVRFGNQERLLLALNISDSFFCLVAIPLKIVTFMGSPVLPAKPLYVRYADSICLMSSTLMIISIAINNYIKISRPSKYDQLLSKKRVRILIGVAFLYSCVHPLIILINLQIYAAANILFFAFILIVLPLFYGLIIRELRISRRRTENHKNTLKVTSNQPCSSQNPVETEKESKKINGIDNVHENNIDVIEVTEERTVQEVNRPNQTSVGMTQTERRVIKNVLLLMAVFFGCGLASIILVVIYAISGTQEDLKLINYGVYVISLRAIINPIIYVFKNPNYRRQIKSLIPRFLRRQRMDVNDFNASSRPRDTTRRIRPGTQVPLNGTPK